MDFELIKLSKYSGKEASIYTIKVIGEENSLLEEFVNNNINLHLSETKDILSRLITIGSKTGARTQFFKQYEGKPGDGVSALYDRPNSKLRLYCIRYGNLIVVVGGGGIKSKSIRAYQEDPNLSQAAEILKKVSAMIRQKTDEKEIRFINNGMDFHGDLELREEDYE